MLPTLDMQHSILFVAQLLFGDTNRWPNYQQGCVVSKSRACMRTVTPFHHYKITLKISLLANPTISWHVAPPTSTYEIKPIIHYGPPFLTNVYLLEVLQDFYSIMVIWCVMLGSHVLVVGFIIVISANIICSIAWLLRISHKCVS